MKKIIIFLLFASICFAQVSRTSKTQIQDVETQPLTTDPILFKFNRIISSTTLASLVNINDHKLVLADTTGLAASNYIIVFNPITERLYKGIPLSVSVDTVTMDSPFDSEFPIGSFVDLTTTNMAVDGSVNPVTFGIRGISLEPLDITLHLTQITLTCLTNSAVDLSKFGDIEDGITNGMLLRLRNGRYFNVMNIKTNSEIAGIMSWEDLCVTNPAQGQDGFIARFIIATTGAVIEIKPGQDIEWIVQDNLFGFKFFETTIEAYIEEP